MTPTSDTHLMSSVRKVAVHRRVDGETLIGEGRYRGGMYLLGYAIECALKAYIGRHLGAGTLPEAEKQYQQRYGEKLSLTSVHAHNLKRLFGAAERLKLLIGANAQVTRAKDRCLTWDYRWRYDPTPATENEAREFLAAVGVFHGWLVQRQ